MSDEGPRQNPKERRSAKGWVPCRWVLLPAFSLTLALAWAGGATPSATAATISQPITLAGAGSTFDAPFFNRAFPAYHRVDPVVSIHYSAVGSTAGIASFSANQVAFGASDVPMTTAEQTSAQGGPSVQVPVDLGAEVLIYNLPGAPTGIHLNGSVIADIFRGEITSWDSPAIAALNQGAQIPALPITVVHRSDGSGTTYIFTDYLSRVDSKWASSLGVGRSINWPVGYGGNGNAGVAALVGQIPGSIGYVERSYNLKGLFGFAAVRNAAGRFVTPTPSNIAAAAAKKTDVSASNFSIVNEPGSKSYPIVGYSWALVYQHQENAASGTALVQLLDWLTHSGQTYAAQTGYVPLPSSIRALARTTLLQIVGPSGDKLSLTPS